MMNCSLDSDTYIFTRHLCRLWGGEHTQRSLVTSQAHDWSKDPKGSVLQTHSHILGVLSGPCIVSFCSQRFVEYMIITVPLFVYVCHFSFIEVKRQSDSPCVSERSSAYVSQAFVCLYLFYYTISRALGQLSGCGFMGTGMALSQGKLCNLQ